jgi:hypothetical protein
MNDNTWDPVNKITMKNMAALSNRISNAERRLVESVPAKYHPLMLMYGLMIESRNTIDQHFDKNEVLSFSEFHEIKELTQDANELAATIKPMIPNELRETVIDAWAGAYGVIRRNREETVAAEVTK